MAALKQSESGSTKVLSENEVKKVITEYLAWQGWTVFNNRAGKKHPCADLFIVKDGKHPVWIVVKATGKKPSKEQWDFIWRVNNTFGGWAIWANSLGAFKKLHYDIMRGLPKPTLVSKLKQIPIGEGPTSCKRHSKLWRLVV